ncbi:MAG: hypothetical protein PUE13_01845 [Clostridiales bacterium]|nr:hypothetical protein [Clostridiales bacterium]
MSQLKKVMSGMKFDKVRNKSLREIYERCKRDNQLKRGYREMASLNLSLAQMCFESDSQALSACEEKLTECE